MRRVVSLFLPTWSTDRVRRKMSSAWPDAAPSPEAPLVTAMAEHGRRVIASVDTAAARLGLRGGMTITRARMLAPELVVVEADPEGDGDALRRLALWAGRRYAPFAAPDPPDGLWIDITGCEGLFGGERALLKDLHRRIAAVGHAVQIACADTPGCAHAVARYVPAGRPVTIEPGAAKKAIALLPIAALRCGSRTATELNKLGFERVEQLLTTERAPVARRFGAALFRRLDQALGALPEPITPIFADEVPRAHRSLLEPIGTATAFAFVINDLAEELVVLLTRAGKGARTLDLFFHRVDGFSFAVRAGTATPTRDAARMVKLLMPRIEKIDAGLGIEAMTLVTPLVEPLVAAQVDFARGGEHVLDLAGLVDTLANRFGARRLYRLGARPSAMPERGVQALAPLGKDMPAAFAADLPRPARLLSPPEPIAVTAMLPDHPPAMFVWRRTRYRVVVADGPERLHGEWWREAGHEAEAPFAVRDYFQVEVEGGGRYWIFRLGDGEWPASGPMQWFLHGAFA
jgi:protein ImuB